MTDNSGKTWMAIGETDDLDAIIETFTADAAITKGDPVYLSADEQVTPAGAAQDCIGIAYANRCRHRTCFGACSRSCQSCCRRRNHTGQSGLWC